MNKKAISIFLSVMLIFLILTVIFFKKDNVREIYVPGFEDEEIKLDEKYGDKKIFSSEELKIMGNEVRDLHERKINKHIESQSLIKNNK